MTTHDLIGVGIGPFNLGLASLLSSHPKISSLFLERKPAFRWHEGLILPGTTLQVPFLADLVSMADPTHKLSFLNYLAAHDRLYKFYFYEKFLIPREEYDDYCRWASKQLTNCRFGESVADVQHEPTTDTFVTQTRSTTGATQSYRSRNIAIGVGTSPHLPKWTSLKNDAPVFHSCEFAGRKASLMKARHVTVIGSGQSAAECVLALFSELTQEKVEAGSSIRWITRASGFFPMEYSKLGLEYFTPDYMRAFHKLPGPTRRTTVANQDLLYKGISISTIADIFDLLYERSIGGRDPGLSLLSNCEVTDIESSRLSSDLKIHLRHNASGEDGAVVTNAVVAATGYRHAWPKWLDTMKSSVLETCERGDMVVGADFRAQRCDGGKGAIFVQNAETFQHGVGAPDLGLGAFRNAVITNQLLDKEHYRVNARTAFQAFAMPQDLTPSVNFPGDIHARAV